MTMYLICSWMDLNDLLFKDFSVFCFFKVCFRQVIYYLYLYLLN